MGGAVGAGQGGIVGFGFYAEVGRGVDLKNGLACGLGGGNGQGKGGFHESCTNNPLRVFKRDDGRRALRSLLRDPPP